ncbi:MAG: tetratricopeptide repeat protein [Candidatus Hodarchaeales archaeon]|jgi:tetratricopeptide (TPR) repeat protein
MSFQLPEELEDARKLIDKARFGEALEIVEDFEKSKLLSPEDRLSMLLTKSRIYAYTNEYEKNVEISSHAHEISQDLGLVAESIAALTGKAYITFIGGLDKAASYISDAEKLMDSLPDDSSTRILRRNLLLIKSWNFLLKDNYRRAARSAQECLELSNKQGNKLNIAAVCLVLGYIYLDNQVKALDFAMKSLEYYKDFNHTVAIASVYSLIARIYWFHGDYNQAMQYCKQGLSIKEISKRTKINMIMVLADIYYAKSELHRATRYRQQAIELSKELNAPDQLAWNLYFMGGLCSFSDEIKQAVEYWEQCMTLSEKWGLNIQMAGSLSALISMYLYRFEDSREVANRYFKRLTDLFNQTRENANINITNAYLHAKANMMKTSTRIRDRMEAQSLFKEIINHGRSGGEYLMYAIGSLCDSLIEELSMNNDPAILGELKPLITKSLDRAENSRNYKWLANTKLLQGKLALIQMNFDEAKQFLTQAQRIAELRGFDYLAREISEEHDKLITHLHEWDDLKRINAPMAERIKLASTNEVLDRIQGRKAVTPPESVDEQSTVLLILAEGGVLVFSFPFSDEWKIDEDLFSSFLSAFKSFSNEVFSKGLDRAKFGEDMMLVESIEPFSVCYLFKGQTYVAKQKLTKFIEGMQNNSPLWQDLNHHYKTSQTLELEKSPQLESLITEIFTSKS